MKNLSSKLTILDGNFASPSFQRILSTSAPTVYQRILTTEAPVAHQSARHTQSSATEHLHSELGLANYLAHICGAVLSPQHPAEAIPASLLPVPSSTTQLKVCKGNRTRGELLQKRRGQVIQHRSIDDSIH